MGRNTRSGLQNRGLQVRVLPGLFERQASQRVASRPTSDSPDRFQTVPATVSDPHSNSPLFTVTAPAGSEKLAQRPDGETTVAHDPTHRVEAFIKEGCSTPARPRA